MNRIRWPSRFFASLIGLDDSKGLESSPGGLYLSEGRTDPRTGGAVVITTQVQQPDSGPRFNMTTDYAIVRPNQTSSTMRLFDLEFELEQNGQTAARSLWVCGRKVCDAGDTELLDAPVALGHQNNRMRNVHRVIAAIQQVNLALRQGLLPQAAKIFRDCAVHEAVGETILLPGLRPEGGFRFDPLPRGVQPSFLHRQQAGAETEDSPALAFPAPVARGLMGLDANTLDPHQTIGPERATTIVDPRNGLSFAAHVKVEERPAAAFRSLVQIQPLTTPSDSTAMTIPDLMAAEWKTRKDGRLELKRLSVLGVDLTRADTLTRMRALSVHNHILHDFRTRRYSPVLDHFAAHDMLDLAGQDSLPPTRPAVGWLRRISLGGEAMEEIADGYGGSLSGFCKVIFHERIDEKGRIDRVGVCMDVGAYISAEPNKGAVGDLLPYLDDIHLFVLTHPHIDHYAGIPVYVSMGVLKGRDVKASPKVIRLLRRQLKTFPGAKDETLWPNFIPLQNRNWVHLYDSQAITRLSIGYAQDGTPHSARTTPYVFVGRYGSEIAGVYLNHSDARFGRHNADGYDGPKPRVDWLDRDFFLNWGRSLAENDPTINPAIIGARPSLFEVDVTSVTRKGWSPTNWEAEANVSRFKRWFVDKGLIIAQLSGSENSHESHLRVASLMRMDVTEFGANLEHAATDMNILGVNRLLLDPEPRGNIQKFLDHEFARELEERVAALATESCHPVDMRQRQSINDQLSCLHDRLLEQEELVAIKNPFKRYAKRAEKEQLLRERYGEAQDVTLGSIRVARTTKTAKAIFSGTPARRLTLVTGTQNTLAEIDAVLVRLSEGRSLFDARPEHCPTARPLSPKTDVILIAQSAIPGNNASQQRMIERLVERGYTVGVAVHDGLELHNVSTAARREILKDLETTGASFETRTDGTLLVTNFPAYAPGHGYEEDVRAKLKLVNAMIAAPNHTVDPRGVQRFCEIAEDIGQQTPGRNFRVFEQVFIQHNPAEPDPPQVFGHGRSWESLITFEIKRKVRQYYGGYAQAQRVVKIDHQSGIQNNGLMAALEQNGVYYASLPLNTDETRPPPPSVDMVLPVAFNRMAPLPERRHAEPQRPGMKRRRQNLQSLQAA